MDTVDINKFELDCVYVISLNVNQSLIDSWTESIRKKLMPWYDGAIVCKKGTNGANLDDEWLSTNGYKPYAGWKLEKSS